MFKKQKPVTSSLRHRLSIVKSINKKPILKTKIVSHKKALGKGKDTGLIVSRHKEQGMKKKYRQLDFKRTSNSKGIVCSIEYDPYRSAFIMSIFDTLKKSFYYTLAVDNVKVGNILESGPKSAIRSGNSVPLEKVPAGTAVCNVSFYKNKGGQISRSAGTFCIVQGHLTSNFSCLELPSKEIRLIPSKNYVFVGKISNPLHFLETIGKAGRSRWLGNRPKVRGVAMNPVDHPNGGGEGKKSGFGRTPWGKPSKGGKKGLKFTFKKNLIIKKRYETG